MDRGGGAQRERTGRPGGRRGGEWPAGERADWPLDPDVVFLNHGSFGSCPLPIQQVQQELRARIERQPVKFFTRDLEGLLDRSRSALARFVGADPEDVVFVPNATTGVNTVLRSLELRSGDELVVTDHAYNACRNALDFVAAHAGARVRVAAIPFPLDTPDRAVAAIEGAVGPRTVLALLDHVTSPTGLVLPLERIVPGLEGRGVAVLVDGAHAPGMLPLGLDRLGASYYTGNAHKWLCCPKGAAFLHVRRDRQAAIRPLAISHGANSARRDRSRFLLEFDWTGTADPTPVLVLPEAIDWLGSRLPGGWPALRARNRALALAAREHLASALAIALPAPDEMIGSLAALPLPGGGQGPAADPPHIDPLQRTLLERFQIEVPVIAWPSPPRRLLRISAQLYNDIGEYEALAAALREALG